MHDLESRAGQRFSGLGRQDQAPFVLGQRLPLVGEELSQPGDRMAHDPPEHVVEVLPGIDFAVFAGLDEAHEQRHRPAATLASDEEPVFATDRDGLHGILRQVVVGPEPPVFQVAAQGLALIQGVINRFPERLRQGRLSPQLFDLLEDPIQERRGMLLPEAAPLLGRHIDAGGLHFMVEPGDAGQDVRRLFGARRCRFVKLLPRVSPASHLDDVLYSEEFIVAAVGVGMDIPSIPKFTVKKNKEPR